jgi:hypothetical protein
MMYLYDDGWMRHSAPDDASAAPERTYFVLPERYGTFEGIDHERYESEETGNEGTAEQYWYYAAAIVSEPIDPAPAPFEEWTLI